MKSASFKDTCSAYDNLTKYLKKWDRVLVAFSGGVDSSLLLLAARDALDNRVIAVTVDSPLGSAHELLQAKSVASHLGVLHSLAPLDELNDPDIRSNPPRRCYFCKRMRFSKLLQLARQEGIATVLEGSNLDDQKDYRPGMLAVSELGIFSPLLESKLDKETIRKIAKEKGLPNWNASAAACLASRIPYGETLEKNRLRRIEQAEDLLRKLGFSKLRVRDHGTVARLEFGDHDLGQVLSNHELRATMVQHLKEVGYCFVSLDLEGYRTGSLNEALLTKAVGPL